MARDINLDGTEISIIKALGFSGGDVDGSVLIDRLGSLMDVEIVNNLRSLIASGYVESESSNIQSIDDVKGSKFHMNSGYMRELKDAMDGDDKPKSKRVRRE